MLGYVEMSMPSYMRSTRGTGKAAKSSVAWVSDGVALLGRFFLFRRLMEVGTHLKCPENHLKATRNHLKNLKKLTKNPYSKTFPPKKKQSKTFPPPKKKNNKT